MPRAKVLGFIVLNIVVLVAAFRIGLGPSAPDLPEPTTDSHGQRCFDFTMPPVFIEPGPPIKYELPVVNSGAKNLRILDVQTSCGCTRSEVVCKELGPNERTTLKLESELRDRVGPFRLTCRLVTDHADQPDWLYTVTMTVYQAVLFAPASLLLGTVEPETVCSREVELHLCAGPGRALPELLSVEPRSPSVHVEQAAAVDEPVEGGTRRRITLRISVQGHDLLGPSTAQVVVRCSVCGEVVEKVLPVSWNVQGVYDIAPSVVYFGLVKAGESPTPQQVRVRRRDGKPFAILEAKTGTSAVRCAVAASGPAEKRLTLSLDPDRVGHALSGEVEVETDDPQHRLLRVGFSALR